MYFVVLATVVVLARGDEYDTECVGLDPLLQVSPNTCRTLIRSTMNTCIINSSVVIIIIIIIIIVVVVVKAVVIVVEEAFMK